MSVRTKTWKIGFFHKVSASLASGAHWFRWPAIARPVPTLQESPGRNAELSIPVDANGSPVSLEPSCWYVCFVPGLAPQWWHPFVHRFHKHVFVIRPDGEGRWLLIESWWNRIMAATLTSAQAERFLRWGARGSVLLVRENIPGASSQVRGWMTCAALVAHHLGRSYWVWTPHQLYRALLREAETVEICRAGYPTARFWTGDLGTALRGLACRVCAGGLSVLGCESCRGTSA